MATVNLTQDSFESTVSRDGITLVDWWASWCGPCKMFAPVFDAASTKHPDITFGKVDTERRTAAFGCRGNHVDPNPDGIPQRHPGLLAARCAAR